MGWLIALGILLLIIFFPLGITFRYNWEGFHSDLLAGPVKIALYPKKKSKKKKTAPKKERGTGSVQKTAGSAPSERKKGGKLEQFRPILKVLLEFLNKLRQKVTVTKLELEIKLAGEDPCDLAVNYGKTCAAVDGLMPQLERVLKIRKRHIWVGCDFTAEHTEVYGFLRARISLGRFTVLAVRYGFRAIREYIMNTKKGGAAQ